MGIGWVPARNVPRRSHLGVLTRGRGSDEGGSASRHRTVHDIAGSAAQRVRRNIQRKVGWIPARVRKRVIQSSLIGDPEAPAQRSLTIAQHIPGKANAGTEVIVIVEPQGSGWRKTS